MLYTNVKTKAEAREFDFGTIHQIAVGESGRGRRLIALTCPENTELLPWTLYKDITIGATKSNKPRIINKKDEELYLLLSAKGGYTRRGCGTIYVPKTQKDRFEVLTRGNGADGDAGRIGTWDCILAKVTGKEDFVVRIRTSGGGYGTPADYVIYHDGAFVSCAENDVAQVYDVLNVTMPFTLNQENIFNKEEWIAL